MLKYGHRWYQPATGRFTQQDSISHLTDPAQGNRYAYAGDDPVNRTDITGDFSFSNFFECAGLDTLTALIFAADVYDVAVFFFGVIAAQPEIDALALAGIAVDVFLQELVQQKRDELDC